MTIAISSFYEKEAATIRPFAHSPFLFLLLLLLVVSSWDIGRAAAVLAWLAGWLLLAFNLLCIICYVATSSSAITNN
jgi:hypothetical protein